MIMKKVFILLILFFAGNSLLFGHDVHYSVNTHNAYVIDLYYADGTKFAYESYEIYKPAEEKSAYQVGRTNASGRITFIPDVPGRWKIKAFTDDGHGVTFDIDVKEGLTLTEKKVDFFERFAKPIFGAGLILIIFSIINIFIRRKENVKNVN